MADLEWTPELVIRLLQEFEKRRPLWDSKHELYHIPSAKYQSWSELAAVFECDIADIRRKLNSVFASHRRERTKVQLGDRSSWYLYKYCSFLPHHVKNIEPDKPLKEEPKVSTQEPEDSDHAEYLEDQNDEYSSNVHIKQEPKHRRSKTLFNNAQRPRLTLKRPIKKRVFKANGDTTNTSLTEIRILETLKSLKRNEPVKHKKDECDSFGEYIAESLRKHDERTQCMIKQAINNILFEQEMKKYSNQEQYVVISNVNVNVDENPLILADQDDK